MEYSIRRISGDELEAFRRSQAVAFGNAFNPDNLEPGRPLFEFERNLVAEIDGQVVGTAGIFTKEMTVPGGALPVAAVTMVSVQPTHRRRGILSSLMRQQFEQIRDRGEPLAALWASESSIYGRFGYGVAIEMDMLRIPRVHAALRADLPEPQGGVRLLSEDEARKVLPPLHDRLRLEQPGELSRTPEWWEARIFRDPPEQRDGHTEHLYALYEGPDDPEGYAAYRVKARWDEWIPRGTLTVHELFAGTPESRVGLWRYLTGVDLVETITKDPAEVEDPIVAMLQDPRRTERKRIDAIWLRVVDVERALSGRKLGAEGRIQFEVHDAFMPDLGGRFELEGGPEGAVCRRTTAEPKITLGAEELGAAYLGGRKLSSLYRVGRVTGEARAVARADAMLSWHQFPHCQEGF